MKNLIKILKSGLEKFGLYYSEYPATVVAHAKDNPERIMIKCPEVWGNIIKKDIWAVPRGILAGADWGVMGTPQLGDRVWVTFRHGNPLYPLYTWGYHTNREKPEEMVNSRIYGFKTPNGTSVIFDDDNDITTLQHRYINAEDPTNPIVEDGAKIVIDENNINLTFKDNIININGDGISISSTTNMNINLEGEANLTSKKDINVKSEGTIKFNDGTKDSMVDINKLVGRLNILESLYNTHTHIALAPFTTTMPPSSGTIGQPVPMLLPTVTTKLDIENSKIKQ